MTDVTSGKAFAGPGRMLDVLRYLVISVGLGVFISVVVSRELSGRTVALGAVVGAVVFGSAFGLGLLVEPLLGRFPPGAANAIRALTYAVGGTAGSFVGLGLARSLVFGVPLQLPSTSGLGFIPVVSAALALLVALPARAYEGMKVRLADSIERLKAAEFAEKELELARAIQQRLLPPGTLEGPGFSLAARNLPARHVGGDFFDVVPHEDGSLAVAVADVAGKGIGAALIMAATKAVLPFLARERGAAEALRALNERLRSQLGRREFVAVAYAMLDPFRGVVTLANAGLPDPYLLRRGESARSLGVPGPRLPLGLKPDVRYEEASVELQPGDRLLLVSDGLPEAVTAAGEPLGYDAFEALLADLPGPLEDAVGELLARLTAASGPTREDDWTVLLLEWRGRPSPAPGA